jgi:hypothetical protein
MKKIILILFVIFLAGCSSSTKVKEQVVKNNNNEEYIFNKNIECLKFKDEISKKLQEKKSPFGDTSLEQIFYSPKINSCLYVEYSSMGEYYNKRLLDILDDGDSSNPLEACLDVSFKEKCKEFEEKILEYKK